MNVVDFLAEELEEFKNEASELLAEAESSFLRIESGAEFSSQYDAIFRAFHSIKGASGMLSLQELQHHMHLLESHFQTFKGAQGISAELSSFFLKGIDAGRELLAGRAIEFDYTLPGSGPASNQKHLIEEVNSPGESKPISEKVESTEESASKARFDSEKIKIFVIDDEESIVEILTDMLDGAGFKVVGFTDPLEAIKKVQTEKPSAILTDMKMPQMTGDQVLAEVRKVNLDVPVIYVSGMLTKDLIIQAMSQGLYSAIEKPFKETHVVAVVENAARRYQMTVLLNRSIDFVMFQFSDLDDWLKMNGKEEQRKIMKAELQKILDARRELRSMGKKSS